MFSLLMRADLDRLPCAMNALYRNVDSIMIYHLLYPHYLGGRLPRQSRRLRGQFELRVRVAS